MHAMSQSQPLAFNEVLNVLSVLSCYFLLLDNLVVFLFAFLNEFVPSFVPFSDLY